MTRDLKPIFHPKTLSKASTSKDSTSFPPFSSSQVLPSSILSKSHCHMLIYILRKMKTDRLKNCWRNLCEQKRKKANLNVIENIFQKNLQSSFSSIMAYVIRTKDNIKILTRKNKQKIHLFSIIIKKIRKTNMNQGLKKIKNAGYKKISTKNFLKTFDMLVKEKINRMIKKNAFQKMKYLKISELLELQKVKKISYIDISYKLKTKMEAFEKIIKYIVSASFQNSRKVKQQLTEKISEKNSQKYRMISQEREKFKKSKQNLDSKSTARNKSKAEAKRQIISLQGHQAVQEKGLNSIINQKEQKTDTRKKQIELLLSACQKRLERKKSSLNSKKKIFNVYIQLSKTVKQRDGTILIPKMLNDSSKLENLDEFLVRKNSILRSEIELYENRYIFDKQEKKTEKQKQNQTLKELIETYISKIIEAEN